MPEKFIAIIDTDFRNIATLAPILQKVLPNCLIHVFDDPADGLAFIRSEKGLTLALITDVLVYPHSDQPRFGDENEAYLDGIPVIVFTDSLYKGDKDRAGHTPYKFISKHDSKKKIVEEFSFLRELATKA